MKIRFYAVIVLLFIVAGAAIGLRFCDVEPLPTLSSSPPDYARYDYGVADEARIIDVGTQPNSMTAWATEGLFHDRILQRQLAATGWKLREHRYRSGKEMLRNGEHRLRQGRLPRSRGGPCPGNS